MTSPFKSFLKKVLCVLMALIILTEVCLPTAVYALTSGPTAPEATSFEPIDTTDMVNPLTGDFTYNLPLLEVPGPEGGYPLSLSYHAGIQPNEEASWVGLGWTLNPGAIARNVNGYPDDFKTVSQTSRSYWGGGTTRSIGVNVGIGMAAASVNFGLEFSQDTYKGFGVGASIGASIGKGPLNAGISVGVSPYGQPYIGGTVGISTSKGTEGLNGSVSIGVFSNFGDQVNVGVQAGVNYSDGKKDGMRVSLLGASIGSSEGRISLNAGGGTMSVHNMNEGRIQSRSSGWSFSLPIPLIQIGVSYKYQRYWSNESVNVGTSGVLYAPSSSSYLSLNSSAYDTYRLLDPKNENIVDNPDPDRLVGGTYPNYDDYTVTAQGLSGSMRPYSYQNTIYTQDKINTQNGDNDVTANLNVSANLNHGSNLEFRFIKDFSNSYRQQPLSFGGSFVYDSPTYGNNDGSYGYNSAENRLAGSKHVEWFTNSEIIYGHLDTKNFIKCKSAGFTRRNDLGDQIGGFMITNASGVTYHYALPAYSYEEEVRTQKMDESQGNFLKKHTPYAYTWYLTAITGPDYVDRNENGEVDKDDWGYWVEFNYGRWTDQYDWRNPAQGYHRDLDNGFKSHSKGKKEVYHLDAIRTRSHTALFVKSIRADAKGGSQFHSMAKFEVCASLKLDNILLLANDQLEATLDDIRSTSKKLDYPYDSGRAKMQTGSNVIDTDDIVNLPEDVKSKCIRNIVFNYDYSLTKGVFNSYDPSGSIYGTLDDWPVDSPPLLGKLTLLNVDFQGKGGESLLPPVAFEYDLEPTDPLNKDNINLINVPLERKGKIQVETEELFVEGDILKFNIGAETYFCTLLKNLGNRFFDVLYLEKQPPSTGSNIAAVKTKNPPYNKDAYDIWGLYKSDYQSGTGANENLSRVTTSVSNQSTDVWSLRKVKASLGGEIDIDYEGDTYGRSILNKNRALIISEFTRDGAGIYKMKVDGEGLEVAKLLTSGIKADLLLLKKTQKVTAPITLPTYKTLSSDDYSPITIESINGDEVVVRLSNELDNAITFKPSNEITSIITGNLRFSGVNRFYGGGLRVKSVTTDKLDGHKIRTNYGYEVMGLNSVTSGSSSGVTSYEPITLEADNVKNKTNDVTAEKDYRRVLYKDMDYLLSISREVPLPGVMYEYVTVRRSDIMPEASVPVNNEGKTVYQYEVFNRGMLGIKEYGYDVTSGTVKKNMAIKDYTARVGNLKRIITYDNKEKKINEKINHYLHDPIADKSFEYQSANYEAMLAPYHYQGLIQERFSDARIVKTNGTPVDKRIMSGRDVYPAIQIGVTEVDYKNGIKVGQEIKEYDFYSGTITKSLNYDSYGNRFLSVVTPAYRVYPALGLKTNDTNSGTPHMHMLSQEASSYVFSVDLNNQPIGVVSASATTWSNDVPVLDQNGALTTYLQNLIWRKKADYKWLNSGTNASNLTPFTSFTDFHNGGQTNNSWKKVGEIKKYNVYSAALEAVDINNNFSASRMGYMNSKVIVSAEYTKYDELAFTGLEDGILANGKTSSQISLGDGEIKNGIAHTGHSSLLLQPGKEGLIYEVPISSLDPMRKDYMAKVWVKSSTGTNTENAKIFYQIDEASPVFSTLNAQKFSNGWYLLELGVPSGSLTGSTLKVGCKNVGNVDFYFDDFRFQPINASAAAYVYDKKSGELTYTLDNNNLYTKYEYDGVGRLVRTFREKLGKNTVPLINETVYNYAKGNVWKNTGNVRCQFIDDTYTGMLELEVMDKNPLSPTYNQSKWILSTLSANCTPHHANPVWVPTGKNRCEQIQTSSGLEYSGYNQREEKDLNSKSSTYGHTQWITENVVSHCPQPPVIAVLEADERYYPVVSYSVHFYNNSTEMIPKALDFDLDINYLIRTYLYLSSTNSTNITNVNGKLYAFKGQTSVDLGTHTIYESAPGYSMTTEFSLLNGLGYTPQY